VATLIELSMTVSLCYRLQRCSRISNATRGIV
jgi:hypothetical protein